MGNLNLDILAEDFIFLEGPRWHEGRLWFSDMWDHCVWAMDAEGKRERIAEVPNRPSGLAFLPDGRRIVVFSGGEAKDLEGIFNEARAIRDGGGNGSIIGRNTFQRPRGEALEMLDSIIRIYQGKQ